MRPRVLLGRPDRGAAGLLAALRPAAATTCVPAEDLARAERSGAFDAVLVPDGPGSRPALAALRGCRTPVVLVARADARRPGRREGPALAPHRGPPFPAEVWAVGDAGLPRDLLPGAFHAAARLDARWVARRLAALGRPGVARPRGLTTIIVPCWNALELTKACLASVLERTDAPFEVVVVDNGSTDGTAAHVRSLRDRRVRLVVNSANLGFARAVNQGLELARGRYAVWLNSDCVVPEGWLGRMLAALERAPWIGAVGPYTNSTSGLQNVAAARYPGAAGLPRFAAAWAMSRAGQLAWTHRLTGFCLLHRLDLVSRIGRLDEQFGLGTYEDLDFCLRVRLAGEELCVAEDVFVHHQGHASFSRNGLPLLDHRRRNRELFLDKWCRRALSFLDDIDYEAASGRRR